MRYLLLFLLASGWAGLAGIVANHIPPRSWDAGPRQEIRLEVLQGWNEIAEATLFFRARDAQFYAQARLEQETPEGPWLRAVLPANESPASGWEYYFQFTLLNGSVETLPLAEAAERPFLWDPKASLGEESADFVLLSDDPAVLAREGYVLAVSWYALEDTLDFSSIQVFVNGKNVSSRAEISSNVLVYREENPRPGKIAAYVTAETRDGRNLYSATWTTTVKASGNVTSLPLNLRGGANAGVNVYASNEENAASVFGSDRDDAWANLDVYAEYRKLALNAYAFATTQDKKTAQAINRFRFGLLLPNWETYVGDYAPDVSKLTMSNRNLRGIYSSYNGPGFGIALAHGEMLRAVDGLASDSDGATTYYPGTFKQEALAMHLRIGKEKGFSFALNTTRNRDIISSLDRIYVQDGDTQIAFPADNLVLGTDARLNLAAHNTVLGLEAAFSLFNKNTLPGALSQSELNDYLGEDAGVDPSDYQDIFIINTSMQPLPLSGFLTNPAPFSAWTAYGRSLWRNNLLNLSYSRVGSYYKALSANYVQNDASILSLSDQFNYKQFFFVNAGLTHTRDNLARHHLETNLYTSFFGQVLVSIPRYPHFSLSYTGNLGGNERNARIDSLGLGMYNAYQRSSGQIALGAGYTFRQLPVAPTTVDIGFRTENYQEERQDPLLDGRMADIYDNDGIAVSVSLISNFIALPLKTQISFSRSVQELLVTDEEKSNLSLMLKGEYRLWEDRLLPWLEFRTTALGGDQDSQSYNNFTLGLQARPWSDTAIDTSLGGRFYNNSDQAEVSYNVLTWRLTLSQSF